MTTKTEEVQAHVPTDEERKRWFSTGFLAHGIGKVDADKHTLESAAMIRPGEALGHNIWIDSVFCGSVVAMSEGLGDKGLKARFGHPDMCSAALGTFLGRWKGVQLGEDGTARGNLHLSSTAAESPKGDLRNYVEQMADKEPDHFGASIVFTRDWDAEYEFTQSNLVELEEIDENGITTGNTRKVFQSPDPANEKNLRHARLSELHAADLVDDPAATDGMFSGASGTALAAQVSEWLDTHPEILKALGSDNEMLAVLERYPQELRPFIERYSANHLEAAEPVEPAPEQEPAESDTTQTAEAEPEPEPEAEPVPAAEEDEGQDLAADLAALTERLATAEAERDEALGKLKALEAGAPPVSATPAAKDGLTPWQRAQQKK